jgi:hypothetical protein
MVLFVASALILPHTELQDGESLRTSFERDGRCALAFLAGYNVLIAAADWYFWQVSPLSFVGAISGTRRDSPSGLCVSSRKAECVITVLFAIVDLGTAFLIG